VHQFVSWFDIVVLFVLLLELPDYVECLGLFGFLLFRKAWNRA